MNKQPNILVIMVDELAPQFMPDYGHRVVKTPNISRLAARGTVFDNAYTSSPLCAPARASFMTGRLCPDINAYDNGAELPASVPTMAHFLRSLGYQTSLIGKMHFIGPDQLHGFEERLTTDIYPANFSWTANWNASLTEPSPAGATVRPILEAGPCIRSMQMDYDDDVSNKSVQKLYDLARNGESDKPFFVVSSFTHPHPPFTIHHKYWDMYDHDEIDLPKIEEIPLAQKDAGSQYLYFSHQYNTYPINEEDVRNARHAYYAMISYTDALIGRLIDTLEETGLDDNTVVVFVSDHGEMLGERGMWYKMSMFEHSVRIPMIFSGTGITQGRDADNTSIIDIVPTLIELAGGKVEDMPVKLAGRSLKQAVTGDQSGSRVRGGGDAAVVSDFSAGGAPGPVRMVKKGSYKLVLTYGYEPLLFNLDEDPDELKSLAKDPAHAKTLAQLQAIALQNYDPSDYDARIRQSQRERIFLRGLSEESETDPNWAFVVQPGDADRFVRGGGLKKGAHATKARYQLPPKAPATPAPTAELDASIIPPPRFQQ
jgi:choline-sulfatase